MSPLIVQTGIGLIASVGFAVRGFFWMDNAAWVTAFMALAFALVALYNEFKLDNEDLDENHLS